MILSKSSIKLKLCINYNIPRIHKWMFLQTTLNCFLHVKLKEHLKSLIFKRAWNKKKYQLLTSHANELESNREWSWNFLRRPIKSCKFSHKLINCHSARTFHFNCKTADFFKDFCIFAVVKQLNKYFVGIF